MTTEQYERMKTQLLLIGSMARLFKTDELQEFIKFIDDTESLGVVNRQKLEEVRGNTSLLRHIALKILELKETL